MTGTQQPGAAALKQGQEPGTLLSHALTSIWFPPKVQQQPGTSSGTKQLN